MALLVMKVGMPAFSMGRNRLIKIGNHTGRNIVKTNFPVAG